MSVRSTSTFSFFSTAIEAYYPVIARNTSNPAYELTIGEGCDFKNTSGYDIAVTTGDDEADLVKPGNDTNIKLTVDETVEASVFSNYVASVDGVCYETLQEALAEVKEGSVLNLLANITISDAWDCRSNGAQVTVPVTINGNGYTLKLTGNVDDRNWNTIFRFEDVATIKNITIDVSDATGVDRGVSSKLSITAENVKFIGNDNAKRAIIFGEGAGSAISEVTATITDCEFTNWSYH